MHLFALLGARLLAAVAFFYRSTLVYTFIIFYNFCKRFFLCGISFFMIDLSLLSDDERDELIRLMGEADRLLYEGSYYEFFKAAWGVIEGCEYVDNWHIGAICEHLEAVVRGELRNLLITIPPRCGKSSLVSVCLCPWIWAQPEGVYRGGAGIKFMGVSYSHALSIRDALKGRRLIESRWYQALWGWRYRLVSDQNTKVRYENDAGGVRVATSVGGTLTGEGGDIIVIDDPHNAVEVESDLVREGVIRWWDEVMSTRLNDRERGSFIVVQQRLHEDDLAGRIIERGGDDWEVLRLPMEYEGGVSVASRIGFRDPRVEDGELLWPKKFSRIEVDRLRGVLGPYGYAGQMQQRPEPRGGGIIKREYFRYYDEEYAAREGFSVLGERLRYPVMEYVVLSVDTAYTSKEENCPSGGVVLGVYFDSSMNRRVVIMDAWEEHLELHGRSSERLPGEGASEYIDRVSGSWGLVEKIVHTCKRYRVDRVLIEDKASGKSVAQELVRLFSGEGFGVELVNPVGDKVARAYAVQPLFADGVVYIPRREWAERLMDAVCSFPRGRRKDMPDALFMGLRWLRDNNMAILEGEREYLGFGEEFAGGAELYPV